MESINHCVLFIISRSLSVSKCNEYNIPIHYAFEKFKFDEITNKDLLTNDQKLFDKFFLKDKECLIKHIKQKLGYSQINFKIKSLQYFEKIYKILESININNLELNFDIIGIIYELHLRSGSSGSGMRDLGQYFTNRDVIKYMIKLCDPKVKSNGEIDKILDPSMGTGGFLTMSIKYLNENNTTINWDANKNNIYGFDIDDNLKNLTLLNVLLETGKDFKNTIVQCDSLKNDYLVDKHNNIIIDKVDVILANEPFGLKNIIHADCCNRIKNLKIRGTKGEPLFLQLMMQSLNEGGRCAVIVPDGVLFNDANLHKLTRKYLCHKLNLRKIISLEDGLFLNTGVKSSILFFVNDGSTTNIEFCKIKLLDDVIVEELVINVDIDKIILNDYSLFINKYNITKEENINGVEYKTLDELFSFETSKLNSGDIDNNGEFNFYSGIASNPAGKHSSFNFNITEYLGIIKGGGAGSGKYGDQIGLGKVFYLTGKNAISNGMYILKPKIPNININIKYIYYYLKLSKNKIMDLATYTTGLGNIKQDSLKSIQIPIPKLQIQDQIIQSLDLIHDTIETNQKQIKNYEQIKKNIIITNTLNIVKKKLGDIVENIKTGKNKPLDNKTGTKYPYYGTGGITGYTDEYIVDGEYILTARNGTIGQTLFINGKSYPSDHMFIIKDTTENIKYIYYAITYLTNLEYYAVGATIKGISKESLINIMIPLPSIEIQEHIVSECAYYDNLINTLIIENNRLSNNKIIDLTLKSISNDKQIETIENNDQPIKIIKKKN